MKIVHDNFAGKRFTYQQIIDKLVEPKLNVMEFYKLIYAGVVDKIERGLYSINAKFYNISNYEVHSRSCKHLIYLRQERVRKAKAVNMMDKNERVTNIERNVPIERLAPMPEIQFEQNTPFSNELTVENCIAFLKNRGYKIMKPVQTFEEI